MGNVVDMTGREIAEGEEVTCDREEQFRSAGFAELWNSAPDMARHMAEHMGMQYPDVVAAIVHSLLREAEQGADRHAVCRDLLEWIGEEFFSADSE